MRGKRTRACAWLRLAEQALSHFYEKFAPGRVIHDENSKGIRTITHHYRIMLDGDLDTCAAVASNSDSPNWFAD
jgi:hypothetical protein